MILYDAFPTLTVWPYAAALAGVLGAGVAGLVWLRGEAGPAGRCPMSRNDIVAGPRDSDTDVGSPEWHSLHHTGEGQHHECDYDVCVEWSLRRVPTVEGGAR